MAGKQFNGEKFISQIKKHPEIYDTNFHLYNDRAARANAWRKVCKAMINDWDNMTGEERSRKDTFYRNKWRVMRDSFMKEFDRAHKKPIIRSEQDERQLRRSAHYYRLMFLLSCRKKRGGQAKNSSAPEIKEEIVLSDDGENVPTPEVGESESVSTIENEDTTTDQYQHQSTAVYEEPLALFENEFLPTGQGNERAFLDDEHCDKMFLLSLLSSLRQLPHQKKHYVRMQIEKIFASVIDENNLNAE